MRIMRPGSRGPTVELLQLALSRCGIYTETDGIFGRATESSLRSFQRSRNLIADGVAGHETHRALLPWYTGYTAISSPVSGLIP